jgi:cellulose synthase/poly-beta-1,6-N-acetylglucosamine synthase-like glycosyltransferase
MTAMHDSEARPAGAGDASTAHTERGQGRQGADAAAGRPLRLGELLVARGLVTPAQLNLALEAQRREGGRLGRQLILQGAVTRRDMYAALADQWQLPMVDLLAEPPGAVGALRAQEPSRFVDLGWVPWRWRDDTLVIATSVAPTRELLAQAAEITGAGRVDAVVTTDWDVLQVARRFGRERLLYRITDRLAEEHPSSSARISLAWWQKAVPIALVAAVVAAGVLRPRDTIVVVFVAVNLLFLNMIGFKVVAGLRRPVRWMRERVVGRAVRIERRGRGLPAVWAPRVSDDRLPVYTILVPVYDEVEVVQKVIANLDRLDWPKSRLDVLILLEEDDERTIAAAKGMHPPEYVRILVVPRGQPQTKPRACNYGLEFARGDYVVIFDAEDRPHADQLRLAHIAFRRNALMREHDPSVPRLACVQASLMYFNADYNLLTRMFAIEYAHWFDAMLPGMGDLGIPIPLGGTSNHFDTRLLRELGGWDPYNVTEDADLGLRIANHGYVVDTVDSATEEEACSRFVAWIRQRTRWIKGYMVTAAVHTRHPVEWFRANGIGGMLSMIGLIIGTPLAFLSYPLALLFTVVTYIGVRVGALAIPAPLLWVGVALMVVGNGLMIVESGIAAWRRYSWRIGVYAVLNPIYWLMHSMAAWRAAWQVLFDPHRWEKTPHGLTADYESGDDG